jgi:ubiquinone/menaquinone biosynthesis C-methylase UbiE
MPAGPLALADIGCGDGPFFAILDRLGYISPARPVYAVDSDARRLDRVKARFPFITTLLTWAESVPAIPDYSLDFVISTMVMEHVTSETAYLDEIRRVLRPGGRAYITTVFKRPWARYFRRRDGRTVLDRSHLREYTDLDAFRSLLQGDSRFTMLRALELRPLEFPLLDPILFRLALVARFPPDAKVLPAARRFTVRIPGYFTLATVVQRQANPQTSPCPHL